MSRKQWILTLFILALAAVWKLWLLSLDAFPFNSDEAIVGLMAKHILSGANPIFFYGQAYMGSLDAYLVAFSFMIFGHTVLAIRVTQLFLFLGTIITTIAIARLGFGSHNAGWVAALLLAIPSVNTTLYTTSSLGGYGEALLIGNLILLVGVKLLAEIRCGQLPGWKWFSLLGLLVGLGLWANGLTLIYSLPVIALVIFRLVLSKSWRLLTPGLGILLASFLVGSLPWWIFAVQNGLQSLAVELMGSAVAVESQPWIAIFWQHIVNLFLFGITGLLGFRPPWEVRWLVLPLIPIVALFWCWVMFSWVRSLKRANLLKDINLLLAGVMFCLFAGFLFTPYGIDPSGRYFLPIFVMLSLIAGQVIANLPKLKWRVGLVLLVVSFHAWGTIDCALKNPPGITTQFNPITNIDTAYQAELIQFLQENGELRGYTNYWVAYPLAFLSDESVIYSPLLPYRADLGYTARDDRYPLYTDIVDQSQAAAYITTHHPALNQLLRTEFNKRGMTWEERIIGDYQVFYHLSQKVTPAELNLGNTAVVFGAGLVY